MTAPALDDWDIVAQARTDRAVFAQLYRAHHGWVLTYVQRRVGRREVAEELAGDVFVRALTGLDRVRRTGSPFAAWLLTITRNVVVDHYRRASTHREQPVDEIPDVHIPGQRCATDAVDAAVTLHGCLAGMSAADRTVLVGRYLHGMSWAEIAAADPGQRTALATKQQCHRAVRRLRRQLGAQAPCGHEEDQP